jgi:hypothetical protein
MYPVPATTVAPREDSLAQPRGIERLPADHEVSRRRFKPETDAERAEVAGIHASFDLELARQRTKARRRRVAAARRPWQRRADLRLLAAARPSVDRPGDGALTGNVRRAESHLALLVACAPAGHHAIELYLMRDGRRARLRRFDVRTTPLRQIAADAVSVHRFGTVEVGLNLRTADGSIATVGLLHAMRVPRGGRAPWELPVAFAINEASEPVVYEDDKRVSAWPPKEPAHWHEVQAHMLAKPITAEKAERANLGLALHLGADVDATSVYATTPLMGTTDTLTLSHGDYRPTVADDRRLLLLAEQELAVHDTLVA